MVKTLHFQCRGVDFIPGQGTEIPVAKCSKKKKKKERKKKNNLYLI